MHLRVMTFNIRAAHAWDVRHRWSTRRDAVTAIIRQSRCHVVALQEVQPFQLRGVLRALPGYSAVRGRRYGTFNGPLAPILVDRARFTVVSSGSFPLPDADDAAMPRVCTWGMLADADARFVVLNTHLDQRSAAARARSADAIAARLTTMPRLITGDMNTDTLAFPGFEGVRPDGPPGTFHGFSGRVNPRLGRIDHVFYDAHWRPVSAKVVTTVSGASDHLPVIAGFELGTRR